MVARAEGSHRWLAETWPLFLAKEEVLLRGMRNAASTQRTYHVGYNSYCRTMNYVFPGVAFLPATDEKIAAWFTFLRESCTASTIRNYFYGVGSAHGDELLPFPALKDCKQACQVLRGIRRARQDTIKRAQALGVEELLRMANAVDRRATEGLLSARDIANDKAVWAAALFAFVGMLRKSAVCGPQGLRRQDVRFEQRGGEVVAWVTLTGGKTMQFGDRTHGFPVPSVESKLCAVTAMLDHMAAAPAEGEDAMFQWCPPQGGTTPMSHACFVTRLRVLLEAAGLKPDDFTGHSLRRGGATLAFEHNVDVRRIMQHGDWKSSVVFQYHQVSDATRLLLPQRMVAAMARA